MSNESPISVTTRNRRVNAFVTNIRHATKKKELVTVWYTNRRMKLGPENPPENGVIVGTYTSTTPTEWIREDVIAVLNDEERQGVC